MIGRRAVLTGLAGGALAVIGLGGYAVGIEPANVGIARYAPRPSNWPAELKLRIVALCDFHACEPFFDAPRIRALCERANRLEPDIILLLGDYRTGPRFSREVPPERWAAELATLRAPLGVHAILGNHDYWADAHTRLSRTEPTLAEQALAAAGILVYINRAVRIEHAGRGFWLAGLGDQLAFRDGPSRAEGKAGIDDLAGTLAQAGGDEPILLMAHEPDIFPEVPARVALTLSGHTHGGQVRVFGFAPVVPSRFGNRYLHGHIVENDRHLIVSAGLGTTGLPIRFGAPPELVLIELGGTA